MTTKTTKKSWADFRREPTPSFARQVKNSTAIGRERIQAAASAATSDPASPANRRAQKELAQRKSAGIVEKLKGGFGHRSTNPLANFVGKPA